MHIGSDYQRLIEQADRCERIGIDPASLLEFAEQARLYGIDPVGELLTAFTEQQRYLAPAIGRRPKPETSALDVHRAEAGRFRQAADDYRKQIEEPDGQRKLPAPLLEALESLKETLKARGVGALAAPYVRSQLLRLSELAAEERNVTTQPTPARDGLQQVFEPLYLLATVGRPVVEWPRERREQVARFVASVTVREKILGLARKEKRRQITEATALDEICGLLTQREPLPFRYTDGDPVSFNDRFRGFARKKLTEARGYIGSGTRADRTKIAVRWAAADWKKARIHLPVEYDLDDPKADPLKALRFARQIAKPRPTQRDMT